MKLNSFATLDLSTFYSKVVIAEMNKTNVYIVGAFKLKTKGYANGYITNVDEFNNFLNELISNVSLKYKIKLDELILVFPNITHKVRLAGAKMAIQTHMNLIRENEIKRIRRECRNVKLNEDEVAVDESPIKYVLDSGKTLYQAPVNIQSTSLQLTSYIHTLPISIVEPLLIAFENVNIDVLDAYLEPLACYSGIENQINKEKATLIINYSYDCISFGYFDNNQLLKSSRLNFGEKDVLKAISTEFNCDINRASDLLDSHFVLDTLSSSDVVFDFESKITENKIRDCVLESFEELFIKIIAEINNYKDSFRNENLDVIITGKWLNYRNFITYFNNRINLKAISGQIDVFGINDNEYITCYGAFIRFITLNKSFILQREEDDDDKISFSVNTTEIKNNSKTTSNDSFLDIFDED